MNWRVYPIGQRASDTKRCKVNFQEVAMKKKIEALLKELQIANASETLRGGAEQVAKSA